MMTADPPGLYSSPDDMDTILTRVCDHSSTTSLAQDERVVSTCCVTVWLFQTTGAYPVYWSPVTTAYWGWCLMSWERGHTSCWQATVKWWQLWPRWLLNVLCSSLPVELPLHSLHDSVSWTLPTCKSRSFCQNTFMRFLPFNIHVIVNNVNLYST